MNANTALKTAPRLLQRLDLGRVLQRRWWVNVLVAVGTIVLVTWVQNRVDCQYMYQVQLDQYLAHPEAYSHPPDLLFAPLITVLMRIVGRLVNVAGSWIVWASGLWLAGLLSGQREIRFGTSFQIVARAWLPFIVRNLVQCVYMVLSGDPIFNPGLSGLVFDNTPPPPGGGYAYVPPTQGERILSALLEHLDLYLLWHLGSIVSMLRQRAGLSLRRAATTVQIIGTVLVVLGLIPVVFERAFMRLRFF